MKVGIWQGSTPERVHVDNDGRPLCGAANRNYRHGPNEAPKTNSFWRTWSDTIRAVDCKRCLVMERRRLREAIRELDDQQELVTERLSGRGGIQVDIEEVRA